MCSIPKYQFKNYLFYLLESQRERYLSFAGADESWGPGASSWSPTWGIEAQGLEPASATFPTLVGSWLYHYITMQALNIYFLKQGIQVTNMYFKRFLNICNHQGNANQSFHFIPAKWLLLGR